MLPDPFRNSLHKLGMIQTSVRADIESAPTVLIPLLKRGARSNINLKLYRIELSNVLIPSISGARSNRIL